MMPRGARDMTPAELAEARRAYLAAWRARNANKVATYDAGRRLRYQLARAGGLPAAGPIRSTIPNPPQETRP